LVEVMNYRYSGHGAADNDRQLYRTKEEEAEARKRDPLRRLEAYMLQNNFMTRETMEAIDEETVNWVEEIYAKADESPFPETDEVYDNVYDDMDPEKGH
jgi:pyruvate dehydrogenase E1 component alpha subunit